MWPGHLPTGYRTIGNLRLTNYGRRARRGDPLFEGYLSFGTVPEPLGLGPAASGGSGGFDGAMTGVTGVSLLSGTEEDWLGSFGADAPRVEAMSYHPASVRAETGLAAARLSALAGPGSQW
jgi:hypothetical protein